MDAQALLALRLAGSAEANVVVGHAPGIRRAAFFLADQAASR
jgi:hypothetical protein